jgi:hypothetical protein
MNIALTKIHAAAGAHLCGWHSLVRPVALGCALACGGMAAAQAGPGEKDQNWQQIQAQREAVRNERAQAAPAPRQAEAGRGEQRQVDPRSFETPADEQRRQLQMQQEQGARSEAMRRSGRLTADERRDLRRQINEAGIDLYRNPPRR